MTLYIIIMYQCSINFYIALYYEIKKRIMIINNNNIIQSTCMYHEQIGSV